MQDELFKYQVIGYLKSINDILQTMLDNGSKKEEKIEISIDKSTGSCPNCEALHVSMNLTADQKSIYECLDCHFVWVNN